MSRRSSKREAPVVAGQTLPAVFEGRPLKDIRGITHEQMDSLYTYAYEFYESGRLDEAEKFFHFLCIYDFYNSHYWVGLAAVHQLKGNYSKAIEVYAVAFAQNADDLRPLLYSGQCHLAQGARRQARQCFDYVLERVMDGDLRRQAQIYMEALDSADNQGDKD